MRVLVRLVSGLQNSQAFKYFTIMQRLPVAVRVLLGPHLKNETTVYALINANAHKRIVVAVRQDTRKDMSRARFFPRVLVCRNGGEEQPFVHVEPPE